MPLLATAPTKLLHAVAIFSYGTPLLEVSDELAPLKVLPRRRRRTPFHSHPERLHIAQSPLSRTIRDLEHDLGVALFERVAGTGTNLTPAGQALAESAPRIFSLVDQARSATLAAAAGSLATMCVALSDGILPKRLAALLASSREERARLNLQLFDVPLAEQLNGLQHNLFDVGFACAPGKPHGLSSETLWQTELVVPLPLRHPLLVHKHVPLTELAACPLALFYPDLQSGLHQQVSSLLAGEAHHSPWRPRLAARRC